VSRVPLMRGVPATTREPDELDRAIDAVMGSAAARPRDELDDAIDLVMGPDGGPDLVDQAIDLVLGGTYNGGAMQIGERPGATVSDRTQSLAESLRLRGEDTPAARLGTAAAALSPEDLDAFRATVAAQGGNTDGLDERTLRMAAAEQRMFPGGVARGMTDADFAGVVDANRPGGMLSAPGEFVRAAGRGTATMVGNLAGVPQAVAELIGAPQAAGAIGGFAGDVAEVAQAPDLQRRMRGPAGAVVNTAGEMLPPLATAVGVGAAAGGSAAAAGATPMALEATGRTFREARAAGMTAEQAVGPALTSGALTQVLGALNVSAALDRFPGLRNVIGERVTSAVGQYVARVGAEATIGGAVNAAQSVADDTLRVVSGIDPTALEGAGGRAAGAFLPGAVLTGGFAALAGRRRPPQSLQDRASGETPPGQRAGNPVPQVVMEDAGTQPGASSPQPDGATEGTAVPRRFLVEERADLPPEVRARSVDPETQPTENVPVTEAARTPSRTASEWADNWLKNAEQRFREAGSGPRPGGGRNIGGSTSLPQLIVSGAEVLAARATVAGIKGGKALSAYVRANLPQLDERLKDSAAEVETLVRGIVRRIQKSGGEPEPVSMRTLKSGVHELPTVEVARRLQDEGAPSWVLNPIAEQGHRGKNVRPTREADLMTIARGEAPEVSDLGRLYAAAEADRTQTEQGALVEVSASQLKAGDEFRVGNFKVRVKGVETEPFEGGQSLRLELEDQAQASDIPDVGGQTWDLMVPVDAAIPVNRGSLASVESAGSPLPPRSRGAVANPEALDRVLAEWQTQRDEAFRPASVKSTIRENTGQTRPEKVSIDPAKQLVERMRAEQRAAADGFRAGAEAQKVKAREALDKARERLTASRERIKDVDAIRRHLRKVVEANVPTADRGKFLKAVQTITTPKQGLRELDRMRKVLAARDMRQAVAEARRNVGLLPKKMFEGTRERAKEIRAKIDLLSGRVEDGATVDSLRARAAAALELAEEIATIAHEDKIARETIIGGQRRQTAEVAAEIVQQVRAKRPPVDMPESGLAKAFQGRILDRVQMLFSNANTTSAMLGDGPFRSLLVDQPFDAYVEFKRDMLAGQDALKDAAEKAGLKWGSEQLRKLSATAAGERLWGLGGTAADVVEIDLRQGGDAASAAGSTAKAARNRTLKITPAEHMAIYQRVTDADTAKALAKPGGIRITFQRDTLKPITLTQADARRIIDAMPDQQRQIADAMKEHIQTMRPKVFDAIRRITGWDMQAVERWWSANRNRAFADAATQVGQDATMSRESGRLHLDNARITKERTGSSLPYVIGDVFQEYYAIVEMSSKIAHLAEPQRQARVLAKTLEVRQAIATSMGEKTLRRLERAIDSMDLNPVRTPDDSRFTRGMQWMNRNVSRALLVMRLTSWLKQIGGALKIRVGLDAKDHAAGVAGLRAREVTEILESHPYFRDRYEADQWQRGTIESTTPQATLGRRGFVASAVRGRIDDAIENIRILNAFDAQVSRVAIASKLAEARRLHPEWSPAQVKEWAGREAAFLIDNTQSSHNPMTQGDIAQRWRGSAASVMLALTGDATKSLNLLLQAAHRGNGLRQAVEANAANIIFSGAITAFLGSAGLRSMTQGYDDEKQQRSFERYARAVARDTFGMVPFADRFTRLAEVAWDARKGRYVDQADITAELLNLAGPADSQLRNVVRGGADILRGATADSRDVYRTGRNRGESKQTTQLLRGTKRVLIALAELRGIPLGSMVQTGRALTPREDDTRVTAWGR
jgi:hypothetical protein